MGACVSLNRVATLMNLEESAAALLGQAIVDAGTQKGPSSALSFIATLLPFSSSLSIVLRPNSRPIHLKDDIVPARRDLVVGAYLRGAYLLDPFYVFICNTPGTRILRLKDIQPDHFRKTEFFRKYYAHARLGDEIGIIVERCDSSHIFVSLGLAYGSGTFSKRGRDRLVFFLPVIAALLLKNWDAAPSAPTETTATGQTRSDLALDQILKLDDFQCLTTREREIVKFMLLGHSSKSIARCLDIAVGTVKNHRKSIYRKLSIGSQSALFARFLNLIA